MSVRFQNKAQYTLATNPADFVSFLVAHPECVLECARFIYEAGVDHVSTSRPVAIIAQSIVAELSKRDIRVLRLFHNELLDIAGATFVERWMSIFANSNLVSRPRSPTEPDPISSGTVLTVTAFLGDLFAVNLIPLPTMQCTISYLTANLGTMDGFRALHFLLMRSFSPEAPPFEKSFLQECESLVIERANWLEHGLAEAREIGGVLDLLNAFMGKSVEEQHRSYEPPSPPPPVAAQRPHIHATPPPVVPQPTYPRGRMSSSISKMACDTPAGIAELKRKLFQLQVSVIHT